MNKLHCNIIFLIVTFMLFTDSFFCLLTDKLKNWLIRSILHVYFNLRQCLVVLKGLFGYLNNSLYSLYNRIKNRTLSFFDPRVRDPHSIIANTLILLASMPAFIFLFYTMFSYKVIFIAILQIIAYIRRGVLFVKILTFVGRYLKQLDFRVFSGTSLAMLKVKALGSVHGVDFYVTKMPDVQRVKFFRDYLDGFMQELDKLEPGVLSSQNKIEAVARVMRYAGYGMSGHYNVSLRVPGSSLFVGSALTSNRPPANLAEFNMLIKGEIININPHAVLNFERIEATARHKAQFLVSNIFNIPDSTMVEVVDLSDKRFNPMFYKNEANVEGIACVLEPVTPLVRSLSGVKDSKTAIRIAKDAQNELFPSDFKGISSAAIVPFL